MIKKEFNLFLAFYIKIIAKEIQKNIQNDNLSCLFNFHKNQLGIKLNKLFYLKKGLLLIIAL